MARVEVQGRDASAEAYRIMTDHGAALVPEFLMSGLRPMDRPSHQEAYEWIAAHRSALNKAVEALRQGRKPKRPYDVLSLYPAPSLPEYSKHPQAAHDPASDRS